MEEKDLVRVRQAVFQCIQQKDAVAMLTKQLEEAEKKLHTIEFEQIPDLMHELGVESVTLDGNITLKVDSYFRASIPVANRAKAMEWLRNNGFGDLIKRAISAQFPAGSDKKADKLIKFLTKEGCIFEDGEQVHHMTLTAFVKEQIQKGNPNLPLDLLGAFVGEKATVKLPKENHNG